MEWKMVPNAGSLRDQHSSWNDDAQTTTSLPAVHFFNSPRPPDRIDRVVPTRIAAFFARVLQKYIADIASYLGPRKKTSTSRAVAPKSLHQ